MLKALKESDFCLEIFDVGNEEEGNTLDKVIIGS